MKAIQTFQKPNGVMVAEDADGNRVASRVDTGRDRHRTIAEALIQKMGWAPVAVATVRWGSDKMVHVMMSPEDGDQRSRGQYWMVTRTTPKASADTEARDVYDVT